MTRELDAKQPALFDPTPRYPGMAKVLATPPAQSSGAFGVPPEDAQRLSDQCKTVLAWLKAGGEVMATNLAPSRTDAA